MAQKRYDKNKTLLKVGEDITTRNGKKTYRFRYQDASGKRNAVYSQTLSGLRDKEKQIVRDMEDGIAVTPDARNITLNTLFGLYLKGAHLSGSTIASYRRMWDGHVKDTIGDIRVVSLQPYHIRQVYNRLSSGGYATTTIKQLHMLFAPSLALAVDCNYIRKNPTDRIDVKEYGRAERERAALSMDQQQRLLDFVASTPVYSEYLPIFLIMIGTGVRAGELLGLTWDNVDMEQRIVSIDHQMTYGLISGEPLPLISAHILRHTACTRMAERKIGVKELQYIMGHANVQTTLDVYTHITGLSNIQAEITRMDEVSYLGRTGEIAADLKNGSVSGSFHVRKRYSMQNKVGKTA